MQNEIIVLENNVVLIGYVTEIDGGVKVDKPHSIKRSAEGFEIQPFLELFTGQLWEELALKDSSILTRTKADNNELLQAYLQKISGIDISQPEILLG